MAARVLQKKLLLFLMHAASNKESLSHLFLTHLQRESPNQFPLQIVEGSHFLESHLGLKGLVEQAMEGNCSTKELKSEVVNRDMDILHSSCMEHISTRVATRIATKCSWLKLWDAALDRGTPGTTALQNLYKAMTRPLHGPSLCPKCEVSDLMDKSVFEH